MLRKLGALSLPVTPRTPKQPPRSTKSKSQTLIYCSAALPDVGAKSAIFNAFEKQQTASSPAAFHELEMLPPETVISILDGFASNLLVDSERLADLRLTAKCFDGKLGQVPKGSILKSSHTVLTYLSWGIKHIEKAASAAEKESRVEHLKKAEQMLRSLTDSMQNLDLQTGVLASARVPNAGYIVGLAHVYLALVWKMRKDGTRSVASHLLEAFVVCPKNARHSFAPELWKQLFLPHLSSVEAWYRQEHSNIICTNYSRSLSASVRSSPSSPMPPAVARAHSLMDLVAGRMSSKSRTICSSVTESKRSEKINMQVNLLFDLYEQSLDEGTQQYARQYQDLIASYYDRFSQNSSLKVLLKKESQKPAITSSGQFRQGEVRAIEAARFDKEDSKLGSTTGGWMGANALQLRRSVYGALFGTVSMAKTNKNGSTNQASSLLHLCNKELPKVLDPMRNLGENFFVGSTADSQPTIRDLITATPRKSSSTPQLLAHTTPKVNEHKQYHRRALSHSRRLIDLIEDSESEVPPTPFHGNESKLDGRRRSMSTTSGVNMHSLIEDAETEDFASAHDQMRKIMRRSSFSNAESTMRTKSTLSKNRNHAVAAGGSLKDKDAPKVPGRGGSSRHEMRRSSAAGKLHVNDTADVNERVKYRSLHSHAVLEERHLESNTYQKSVMAGLQPPSEPPEIAPVMGGQYLNMEELARELRDVVSATRCDAQASVGRCEEVLLRLSQAWLNCKSATLEVQELGGGALDGLTDELLFILASSELQEAQRLALCLLSASIARRKGKLNDEQSTLSASPNVLQALSHLLQQQGRIPEAALLLHLLHPGRYSGACHNYLPHLLPLLLDLAKRNPNIDNCTTITTSPFGRADRLPDSLTPRALALMMMSRLLSAVDRISRLQTCKHILYPDALPCLLHSLDCAFTVDERAAAAFILTACMQADEVCRQSIVTEVKVNSVVVLLQQSAPSASAFQTAINFVTEVLCSKHRRAHLTEMLLRIRQDGVLNCMHALMAYLQTASLENQPPAAGLLLQLDLLLGDEQKYSVFREEALEAMLAPLFSENNQEASFNAARVLSTIGRSHSKQELEAWLLRRAGLATQHNNKESHGGVYPVVQDNMSSCAEDEEESAAVAEWDQKVARALIRQAGGQLVSCALATGLRSSMAEVRKACLLVAAWVTSHLKMDQVHNYISVAAQAATVERMKEALQQELQAIAAVGSGCAIDERVFAALALQNLGMN